jgi:hypothetical protein
MNRRKVKRVIVSLSIVVVLLSLCAYVFWWRPGSERARCSLQLRNYNTSIASCGIDSTCNEAWKDPEATKKLVDRLFQQKIPVCSSGGVYSIVYGRQPHPELPTLVCSLEGSCGHRQEIDYTVSISVKQKNTTTVIHLW